MKDGCGVVADEWRSLELSKLAAENGYEMAIDELNKMRLIHKKVSLNLIDLSSTAT